jgi:DNA-binding beta-propeller fold protein YncE
MMHRRSPSLAVWAALIAAAGLLIAAVAPPWPQARLAGPSWPAPPDLARIRFVTTISTPSDIGAGPSLLGRLWSVVAGRTRRPELVRPQAVATDSTGRLLVVDTEQQMVHVFDPGRKRYGLLAGPFGAPVSVAIGPGDVAYVSDAVRRKIFAFGPNGKLLRTLGEVGGEPVFGRPTGVAIGPDGLIYVLDSLGASVTTMSPLGTIVRTFGEIGSGPGQFNRPTHLAFGPDGLLYVVDALNARIQVFNPNGTFVRSIGKRGIGTGDFDKPKGIAFDPDGHVYVAEALHDVVQIFDRAGRLLLVIGGSGTGPGQFALPNGVHVDQAGRVYVADAMNSRVQVFQYVHGPDGD